MRREFNWKVTLGGKECTVNCVISGGQYVIYAGEEHIATFEHRWGQNTNGGLDEQMEINGEKCRFVVWNDQPDLVVRGQLQGEKINYGQEKEARRKVHLISGIVVTVIGAITLIVTMILYNANPEGSDRISYAFLCGVVALMYGIYMIRKWLGREEKSGAVQ